MDASINNVSVTGQSELIDKTEPANV